MSAVALSNAAVGPSNAAVVALVADARTVPSNAREAFAAATRQLPEDDRRIVVHTCHRVEVYSAGEPADAVVQRLPPGGRRLDGQEAVRHILRVACALESAVFGETEILHQLREAFEQRRATVDPVLDRLFQVALRAGREARSHHGGVRRSLADVAVDRIPASEHDAARPLTGRSVVVVGAGRMGRLAADAAARRGASVVVANRTARSAAEVARRVRGATTSFENPDLEAIPELAAVIVAIAGPWRLRSETRNVLGRIPPVVVDLSSPPALDPILVAALGQRYVSVDEVALPELASSPRVLTAFERIVDRTATEFQGWLAARHAGPVIAALSAYAEAHRCVELDRLRRRLPDLGDTDLAVVDHMSRRLVAAVLHGPLAKLGPDGDPELEPAARRLFGL